MKRTGAGTLSRDDDGKRVLLQGWLHRRRDHGGVLFLDLRDASGLVQVVVRPGEHADVVEVLDPARQEWVLEVEGTVAARAEQAVNPNMKTGEIEVVAERATVLARSEPLPFNVEGTADATEETRLRYRYLDLRREELQRAMRLRSDITIEILDYFREQDFVYLETPILTRSTPEGARDYLVPSRVHQGSFYALPQSPQLFKQILMVSGFERYVQIARCFRDEDLRADRQPEFTQVDVEMSFNTEEDIYTLIEGLYGRIFPLAGIEPPARFPRLTYADAMARYGSDKPDLRCDLEIVDVTDSLSDSSFRVFQKTVASGGVIRAIVVPGGADASRKQIDVWSESAQRHGAAGVLWIRRQNGEITFQVKGTLTEDELERVANDLKIEEGGLALLIAAPAPTAAASLGALRLEVARDHGLMREDSFEFVWVTEFPLVEWHPEDGRWYSVNHPFTAPMTEDLALLDEEPGKVRARAYDVVLNGMETGGGSLRIHDAELQKRVFKLLDISPEEARQRFGFLLDALSHGAPPHGGIALGLDRLVMLMAGVDSLRDVIPFPKTASAVCLMTEAPSPVDSHQLQELGVRVRSRASAGDRGGESA